MGKWRPHHLGASGINLQICYEQHMAYASRADQSEVNLTFKGQNLPLSSQGTCACTMYTKLLIDLGLPGLEARSLHVCGTMFHFTGQVSCHWKLGCVINRSCWLLSRLCFSASICSQGISILASNVKYCQDLILYLTEISYSKIQINKWINTLYCSNVWGL